MTDSNLKSMLVGRLSTVIAGLIIAFFQAKGLIFSPEQIEAFNSLVSAICSPETFDLVVQGVALIWASAFALVSKVKEKLRDGKE